MEIFLRPVLSPTKLGQETECGCERKTCYPYRNQVFIYDKGFLEESLISICGEYSVWICVCLWKLDSWESIVNNGSALFFAETGHVFVNNEKNLKNGNVKI